MADYVAGTVIVSGWQQWSRHQQARALTTEAFQLVRQGNIPQITQANLLFRNAIELDPRLAPAYAGLAEGMARSGESRPDQARAMQGQVVALAGPLVPTHSRHAA